MTRRQASQLAALTDAVAFLALRCAGCGSAELIAVAPGDPDTASHAWCPECWPAARVGDDLPDAVASAMWTRAEAEGAR